MFFPQYLLILIYFIFTLSYGWVLLGVNCDNWYATDHVPFRIRSVADHVTYSILGLRHVYSFILTRVVVTTYLC
jgi:TRAP-type C4-dicarboxylate transport system permease small subunit